MEIGRARRMPARRMGTRRWAAIGLGAALLATACETPRPSPTPTPGASAPAATVTPTAAAIDVVEVTPAAVLLTAPGESKQLVATTRLADGTAGSGTATWESDDPDVATVDASGAVTAVALGSTTLTATVDGVASEPVHVTVAELRPGVMPLTDAQVVEGPVAVDPGAEPTEDAPYEVVLRGVTGIEAGTVVVGTEGATVGGRVISTAPEGSDLRVRLVGVPPGDLFTEVEFRDTVDLATGELEVPEDLAVAYDVARNGSTLEFTPKAASAGAPGGGVVLASHVEGGNGGGDGAADEGGVAQAGIAQGTHRLPPFHDCEFDAGGNQPLPLALSVPPSFTFTAAGTATREATSAGTKISIAGTPTFSFESTIEVKASFQAKVTCKVTLATRKFRAPGWAGLFFGGDVEFGVGFEISGRVTVLSAKVGGKATLKPTFSATLDCPAGGSCDLSGNTALNEPKLEPVLEAPNLNQLRFDPSVNLFGYITLEAGNADVDQLQFKAIEARAGLELAGSLRLEGLQIDNTAADGRAKYALAFKGEVGPGVKLSNFLRYLGLSTVVPLKIGFQVPMGETPTGTARADRPRYLPGETGTVTVILDAASTIFPSSVGVYNVDRVVVVRRDGLTTEVVGSMDASEGQTTFEVPISVSGLVDADELYAFVVTSIIPLDPPKLEVGPASWSCEVEEPLTIDSLNDDPDKIYVVFDGESDCRLVAETGDGHFPAGAGAPDVILSIDTDPGQRAWDGEDSDDEDDGQNWVMVAGSAQDIPNGRHTFRSRRVESGTVYVVKVTVQVDLLGGDNTRMKVSEVSITLAP